MVSSQLKVVHLFVGGNNLLQLLHIGASHVGYLGLVLEEDEGRHGRDLTNKFTISLLGDNPHNSYLVLRSNVLAIINVDLQDDHVAHGLGNLLEVGSNHLARSTPGSGILLNQYEQELLLR